MSISEFADSGAIQAQLVADEKEAVIRELVVGLVEARRVSRDDDRDILKAILKREELGSTAIGNGVAVPHTKHPSLDRVACAVGISRRGVDFDALDGEKVHLFFLLVSPTNSASNHLRALEQIAQHVRDESFCQQLKQAETADDIRTFLEQADGLRVASGTA